MKSIKNTILILLLSMLTPAVFPALKVKPPAPITGDPVVGAWGLPSPFFQRKQVIPDNKFSCSLVRHSEGNGGYAHLLTEVKLSVYRDAVWSSCGHLHGWLNTPIRRVWAIYMMLLSWWRGAAKRWRIPQIPNYGPWGPMRISQCCGPFLGTITSLLNPELFLKGQVNRMCRWPRTS